MATPILKNLARKPTPDQILRQSEKLQKKCEEVTKHDLNCDDMHEIGPSWFAYSKCGPYMRIEVVNCRCRFCGYVTVANRKNNDRSGRVGEWKEGESSELWTD